MSDAPTRSRELSHWDERYRGGDQRRQRRAFRPAQRDERGAFASRAMRSLLDRAADRADSDWMRRSSGLLRPRVIFGTATLMGVLTAFQAYYYVTTFDTKPNQATFPLLLLLNLNYWYSWALLTPAILWLVRRFPLERSTWRRSVPVHLVGVFLCTLTHVAMVIAGRAAVYTWWGTWRGEWAMQFREMFFLYFDWEMMTYWTIVGLGHALRYHHEAQDRALTASKLETRLVEAQLQTLQRQLQPHFLFNTLNTVSALMHRDVEAADRMLAQLGDLLRLSFETVDVQEVSLAQELDFLRKYVAIEQVRFQERLHVTFAVDPAATECLVPNLLLQPLVENAIRHGIGPRVEPGHVLVRAARVGDLLELEVRDDGVGVPQSALADLSHGVGWSNTRSRLAHLYGDRHRFTVSRPAGGGLSVAIAIPVDDPATEADAAAIEAEEMEGVA